MSPPNKDSEWDGDHPKAVRAVILAISRELPGVIINPPVALAAIRALLVEMRKHHSQYALRTEEGAEWLVDDFARSLGITLEEGDG